MVNNLFTLVSGTYATEQDLLGELDTFLTAVPGWQQIDVPVDTGIDKEVTYYTDGSEAIYDRSFFIFRARNNRLELSIASNTVSGIGSSDVVTAPFIATGVSSGNYWFVANEDVAHILIKTTAGQSLHGGVGRFNTYYTSQHDHKPVYAFGQSFSTQTFSANRLVAYGPRSWGSHTLTSGTGYFYGAAHPTELVNGVYNPRDGQPKPIEPVFYTTNVYPYYEVRGEVPGLYISGGQPYDYGNIVTVTGTFGFPEGKYFVNKGSNAVTWFVGPTTSG
jgi:hypothetical protein